MKNKNSKSSNIEDIRKVVNSMYVKNEVDVKKLLRKFRPYCHTSGLDHTGLNGVHSIQPRFDGSFGVGITRVEPFPNGLYRVTLHAFKRTNLKCKFFVSSNKELMQKILNHGFFEPNSN